MELVLIIGLFWIAHRLRRPARVPQRSIDIHIWHYIVPGPGEALPDAEPTKAGNVIPFRRAA